MAPAVRVALGEEFGMAPGENSIYKIYTALHMIGFDLCFDTSVSADMTIIEETNELAEILSRNEERRYPLFTSCCPAWVRYVENKHPPAAALHLHQQISHGDVRRSLKGIL